MTVRPKAQPARVSGDYYKERTDLAVQALLRLSTAVSLWNLAKDLIDDRLERIDVFRLGTFLALSNFHSYFLTFVKRSSS